MIYTKREKLTVLDLETEVKGVSLKILRRLIIEQPSNMIYCVVRENLIGIISMGDIYRAFLNNMNVVYINKRYTYLYDGEYVNCKTV